MNDGILPTPEERAKEGQVQKELKKEKQEKDLIQLQSDQAKAQISQARFTKAIVIISVISGVVSFLQFWAARDSANAAKVAAIAATEAVYEAQKSRTQSSEEARVSRDLSERQSFNSSAGSKQQAEQSLEIARKQIEVSERPWVKVSHRIISPLTFDVGGRVAGNVAMTTIEDTFENVGQTVALNVLSWEDVMPRDSDFSNATAMIGAGLIEIRARREPWGLSYFRTIH